MINEKLGEILAPVGNREMLYAAVRSGADAVYLGTKDFSARRNAENFTLAELEEVVCYCHIRGVKVYLTLNILIKECELSQAFTLAQTAYNFGIDGIIIEDIGLARILHKKIPDLKLHASTQMSVHSPSALPLLKSLGISQVVVAREMSKPELIKFCKKARELDITVEAFVHGALCMSVSGQCLLSAFLGSRSGNRGLCAGPCRLPFKAPGGTGYDLSLKDLSLLDYARELLEIGVKSFKIEGRMKRPEYVAAATFALRQALYDGHVEHKLNITLKNVFSRSGFTCGYYENKLGRNMFGVRTKEDVLSADHAFPILHEIYRNERKSIPLDIKLSILENTSITLTLTDQDKNTVTVTGGLPQMAQNKPLTKDSALKNINKFGNTPYYKQNSQIFLDDNLFVTAGELNELRRKAVEALDIKRSKNKISKNCEKYSPLKKEKNITNKKRIFARFQNDSQIPDDNLNVEAIILPIEQTPKKALEKNLPIIADIPRGILNESFILERLKLFKTFGCKQALCGNLAAIQLAKSSGFSIIADTGMNIANSESLNQLSDWGLESAVISCEQTVADINQIPSSLQLGILAYGNIPLMLFKNCPIRNGTDCTKCNKSAVLTDRLGTEFPVKCRSGYSELLNSVPIWLADRQNDFNCDFLILYFTNETPQTITQIIDAYKKQLNPDIKHTRGLYYRGTI